MAKGGVGVAYSELIKSFGRVREYMRQFYVYGFKSRGEYDDQSARSYDNERRRIESWLKDYMSFRRDGNGKNVFLSVDSRAITKNPLYSAFKAKSFTNGDITFHFYILDLLADGQARSVKEIVEAVADEYLSHFSSDKGLDESTIRKKLKEYEALGLLKAEKRGRELIYSRAADKVDPEAWRDAAAFFSEEDPLGVIGSFLLDKYAQTPDYFGFKHHYILRTLDSQVLCDILLAINDRRNIELTTRSSRRKSEETKQTVFPSRIFISTQSGRQYLLCYHKRRLRPTFFRLDSIQAVKPGAIETEADKYDRFCDAFRRQLWGVSAGDAPSLDHIAMTVHVGRDEHFIIERLKREKRCGAVEALDAQTYRFSADVYDAAEMLPWLRTFIGRIEKLECSDKYVTDTFYADFDAMRTLYGGDEDAVQ